MKEKDLILNKEDLIRKINEGFHAKYLFFWGHQSQNQITKSCLSQWYAAPFKVSNLLFQSAEHYMMAEKAKLFQDDDTYQKILLTSHPGEAKKLGRQVKDFDEALWQRHRFDIVVEGNLAKFAQNLEIKEFLLNTGNRILVEASPVDTIWGIGLSEEAANAASPSDWLGLNLLGFALMKTRYLLAR